VLLGMLPYSYDTGGQVQILPAERGQAVARTDGELVKLLVQEGDVVTAGQPVAELSSWDQENQIAVTEASLDGARAQLAKLMAGSTAEDIALAQAKVASAEANLAYAQAQADRARSLVTTGAMSASDKEKAENQLATVLADLEVAKANLKVVEAGATPEDIAIDQANIEKLERQLAYARDEMARTFVVAPVAGHIVTKDLNLKMGSNLKSGDTLLDIERTDVVTARIDIPEGDVPLLKEGSPVRLKLQGYKDETIVGSVHRLGR
jgi:multidrug resistance efflux pump